MYHKKKFKKLFLVLILSSFLAVGLEGAVMAQEVGADVHIKVEASANTAEEIANGEATWVNYSGTEFSGRISITANPGDKIYIRTKIWNSATGYTATSITGTSQTTNFDYVTSALENDDPDGSSPGPSPIAFNPYFFVGAGNGAIAEAYAFGSEDDGGISEYGTNCEGLLTSITLDDSFPSGQTIITAQATISDYEESAVGEIGLLNKLGIAYAQGVGRSSMVRVTVGEDATPTPTATISSTATPEPTATPTATATAATATLPTTGSDNRNKALFNMSVSLLVAVSSIVIGTLVYRIKKST